MRKWLAPMLYQVYQNEPDTVPPTNIEPFTFDSPAKGDTYDFSVTLHRTVRSPGRRARAVFDDEVPEAESVLQRAFEEIRPVTRQFEITEAGAAELAANQRLASVASAMTGSHRWIVRAEVNICEEVRQLNRDTYRKQHAIRSEAAAALLHIESTDKVRLKWQKFLAAVEGSDRAAQTIQLTADRTQLPEIIRGLVERREQNAQELLSTVDRIMQSYLAVDMLDFVMSNETVLRRTLELLGLPIPPLQDESILVGEA
ncbi:hypothetical protein ABZ260_24915 [Streptosporangium sp. NPDC006013]|uniref:hypothetical protein n=1 Tax=Streptosporangium sp. NPDC006013 TaxID=3155596 RepID=UPI0033A79748